MKKRQASDNRWLAHTILWHHALMRNLGLMFSKKELSLIHNTLHHMRKTSKDGVPIIFEEAQRKFVGERDASWARGRPHLSAGRFRMTDAEQAAILYVNIDVHLEAFAASERRGVGFPTFLADLLVMGCHVIMRKKRQNTRRMQMRQKKMHQASDNG